MLLKMWKSIRQLTLKVILFGAVLILLLIGVEGLTIESATASLRQIEEAPGQTVYQSRQALQDQHNHSWQAIAFNRIRPNGDTSLSLRLVGFPGVAEIDRSRPLVLTDSLGNTLTAKDTSQQIFEETTVSAPNVGQYDLAPIIFELKAEIPLQLNLPTLQGEFIRLSVPPTVVQEWQILIAPA